MKQTYFLKHMPIAFVDSFFKRAPFKNYTLPARRHFYKPCAPHISELQLQKEHGGAHRFFDVIKEHKKIVNASFIPHFLCDEPAFKKVLYGLGVCTEENYLMGHFAYWLSKYAVQANMPLRDYFCSGDPANLSHVCKDFIAFCFENNIFLDADKTLQSFNYHNQLSDFSVKEQLLTMQRKDHMNILGFGLDEGHYEKALARFLVDSGIANEVTVYGFDPYALKVPGIKYLTPTQLCDNKTACFDLVTARWVLHHVELQHRWGSFIKCINNCNPGAMALIVEHGFLKESHELIDRKLYFLLNAIFDIVANIGLRPRYFTSTVGDIGSNFFIKYLEPEDFNGIKNSLSLHVVQNAYEVGPHFPNQTVFCMRVI